MKAIDSLLDEIRFEILKVIILNAFLDATIFFLALMLILSVFGIWLFIPISLSILFFAIDTYLYYRKFSLRKIEETNPAIREMLRTAADNRTSQSLMATALFSEVMQKMREVSSGSFIDFKKVMLKISAMFVLSIVLVSLAFFNVNIQKFENPLLGTRQRISQFFGEIGADEGDVAGLSEGEGIYGEASIARLGDQDLDITFKQSLNQIDFSSVSEADPSSGDLRDYPVDVEARASDAYTGGLEDVNDRKTAAEYSQQIKR